MLKKFSPNIFSILLNLIVPVLALWQVSFFAYTMKWDIMDQFFTCRYFLSECLHNKILPFWCPYINFGYPFYADPQGGFFYPVTWIIALLGGYNSIFISAEYLFHVWVAGISFYFLAKQFQLQWQTALVFGISYCLSGLFISNAQHLSWIISMAWMPLVVLSFLKLLDSPRLLFSFSLGISAYLMLSGGYPAFAIMLFYVLLMLTIFRLYILLKDGKKLEAKAVISYLLIGCSVAGILSFGFLYSFYQSLPFIDRGNAISEIEANSIPFTLQAAISFFFPFVTVCEGYETFTDISMTNIYGGILLLPFLIVAVLKTEFSINQRLILAAGIVFLLASFGKLFPVRTWLYHLLPGMDMFRHAAIFRNVSLFLLLLIAATGFNWMLKNREEHVSFVRQFLTIAILLLSGALLAALIGNSFFYAIPSSLLGITLTSFNEKQNALTHIEAQSTFQIILLTILLIVFLIPQLKAKRLFVFCLILIMDIMLSVQLNVPATVISNVPTSKFEDALKQLPEKFPVPVVEPMINVSHMGNGFTEPVWFNTSILYKRPAKDGFNNFFLKGILEFYNDSTSAKFIEHPVAFFQGTDELDKVEYSIRKFSPSEMLFDYSAKKPARFVLLQANYPGWKAFCDNAEVTIEPERKIFMSCNVPSGQHQIRFSFAPLAPKILFVFTCVMFFISMCILGILYFRLVANKISVRE